MSRGFISAFVCFLALASNSFAQSFTVKGRVLDESRSPVPGALVRMIETKDSTQYFVTSTDFNGDFILSNLSHQDYTLLVTAVGKKDLSTLIRPTKAALNLGTLIMSDRLIPIKGVIVQGRVPPAVQVGDTTNYSAKSVKVNEDATMGDLLSKLPGMVVSNGTVTVGGEQVQQVLIDGRPYFGQDPTIALSNIPANIIDKVQVYDQESDQAKFTGFDDGNDIKTINIITRWRFDRQSFGKVGGGYGENQRYSSFGNVNIFDGNERLSLIGSSNNINQQAFSTQDILGVISTNNRRFMPGMGGILGGRGPVNANPFGISGGVQANNNLVGQQQGINTTGMIGANGMDSLANGKMFAQGSYFFNQVNNQNIQSDNRVYLLGGNATSLYDQNSNVSSRNFNNRFSGRLDYWPDATNGITVLPVVYFQSNRSNDLLSALTSGNSTNLQSNSVTSSLNNGYNLSGHVIYRHKFDYPGRTISLDVGVGSNQKTTNGNLSSSDVYSGLIATPGDSTLQQSNYLSSTGTASASLIYTEPFPFDVSSMLEFFYDPSFTKNTASKYTYNFDPVTEEYSDLYLPLSNAYSDNYATQSVGMGYRWHSNGMNLMANLSYQYASLQGFDSTSSSVSINRKFGALLPMAMFNYRTREGRFLRIFFRSYTAPPAVTQLQPVVDNSNPLLLTTGNPNLNQSYTQTFMARYNLTRFGSSQMMSMFLFANHTNNYVGSDYIIPSQDTVLANGTSISKGAQLTFPINQNGYWNVRSFFTFGLPFDLISSLLNLNAGVTYARTPGIVNSDQSVSNTVGPSAGVVIASDISQDFDFTISYMGNYNFAENTLLPGANNNYYSHTATVNWYWQFWSGFVLDNQVTNELTSGLAAGYNENFVLWNISVGKKFLPQDAAQVQLSVNDLLGENKSVQRTITSTYIDDTNNEVLTRYVLLTFSYTVR